MADLAFHHGTRVFESAETPVLIRTAQSAVVALIGTAPDADESVFPLNTPVLIKGMSEFSKISALGNSGTLKQAADAVFDQIATYLYIIRVAEGGTPTETLANLVGDQAALSGVHALLKCESLYGRKLKPRLVAVPGFTSSLATDGVTSINVTQAGADYTSAPTVHIYPADATIEVSSTAASGNTGDGTLTLATPAYDTGVVPGGYTVECVTVAEGSGTFAVKDPAGTRIGTATVGEAYEGPIQFTITAGETDFEPGDKFVVSVEISGGTGQGAEALALLSGGKVTGIAITKPGYGYGLTPPLVAFSGGSSEAVTPAAATANVGTVANPVVAELQGVLEKVRAVAFVDGPDTTDEAAVLFRQTINSQRIYVCDPKVLVFDTELQASVAKPSSAFFVGVQARVDRQLGFWWSLSNKPVNGILGAARPVRYGDHANYLNENHVNTIINLGEGFITWGNRVATGADLWKFISVRRTADFINEAIEDAYLEFVDRPFSKANLKFMVESGRAFMKTLIAEGAILGGDVWLPEEPNTPEEMAQGRVTLAVKFEPPAPMEDIRLIAHREIQYYVTLLQDTISEIQGGILSA